MGILIKRNDEINKLVTSNNIDYITDEFFFLLSDFINASQKQKRIERETKNLEKTLAQFKNNLQTFLHEQANIDSQIRQIIESKESSYQTMELCLEPAELISANNIMTKLMEKQKRLNSNILQATMQIKNRTKAIDANKREYDSLDQKLRALRVLLKEEYKKINWEKLGDKCICLSQLFENVENNKIRQLLKNVTRKNIELEKSIVLLLQKECLIIVNNGKVGKSHDVITTLMNVNCIIYGFLIELLSRKDLSVETIYLLQQLDYILNSLNNYSKQILNRTKQLDLSRSIAYIKSISELNQKTVIRNCRPTILHRKKLEKYNFDSKVIENIVSELVSYLEAEKQEKARTYYIC